MAIFKKLVVFLFLFLLPTQLGKHFFLDFSYVDGVRVDYLSLVLYATDILALMLVWVYREIIIKELRKQKHFVVFLGLLVATNILASKSTGWYSSSPLVCRWIGSAFSCVAAISLQKFYSGDFLLSGGKILHSVNRGDC